VEGEVAVEVGGVIMTCLAIEVFLWFDPSFKCEFELGVWWCWLGSVCASLMTVTLLLQKIAFLFFSCDFDVGVWSLNRFFKSAVDPLAFNPSRLHSTCNPRNGGGRSCCVGEDCCCCWKYCGCVDSTTAIMIGIVRFLDWSIDWGICFDQKKYE